GRVDEAAVQLGAPVGGGASGSRDAAAAEQFRAAGGGDAGAWYQNDPETGESGADREVQPGVDGGQARVESAELRPQRTTHQHALRGDAEHVIGDVVLRLVEFVLDERQGGPEPGHRFAELGDGVWLVPAHELRAGDGHGRCDLDG